MRTDDNTPCVRIGEVIDRIFRNGVSLDCLRDTRISADTEPGADS